MDKKLSYSGARDIRNSGLSNQITERLLSGESVSSSFSKSISERTLATFTGLQEKMDPLNIARVLSGGSSLAPALLGKMLGRSQEDMQHFSGTGKAKQKNPLFLSVVKSTPDNIRVNDTFANALGKLYTLFKSIDEEEKLSAQLRKDFQQERIEEEQRRNEEVLRQIRKVSMRAKRINDAAKKVEKKKEGPPKEKTIAEQAGETASRIPGMIKGAVGALGVGIAGYGLSRLLKKGEAATYNTIFGGSEVPLDTMTIDEVIQFQSTMKGGSTAVGKYQIIKSTLVEAKNKLNLTGKEKFDQGTQDLIYNEWLVGGKRQSVRDYISGKSDDIKSAALDLAKEFASFPVVERIFRPDTNNYSGTWIEPGESYYKGVGKNPSKASISVDQVLSGLQEERDIRTGQKQLSVTNNIVVSNSSTQNTNVTNNTMNTNNRVVSNSSTQNTNVTNNTMNNNSNVTQTASPIVDNKKETPKVVDTLDLQIPQRSLGEHITSISSENVDIKKVMSEGLTVANIGNNVNFTYKPGDSVSYFITPDESDLPSVIR